MRAFQVMLALSTLLAGCAGEHPIDRQVADQLAFYRQVCMCPSTYRFATAEECEARLGERLLLDEDRVACLRTVYDENEAEAAPHYECARGVNAQLAECLQAAMDAQCPLDPTMLAECTRQASEGVAACPPISEATLAAGVACVTD